MNANGHFEEEDLALYAMHLLAEPEASAVRRGLAESEETRRELAEVQARLAAYAETAVELQAVPEGSLDRLLTRIAQEKKVVSMPPVAERAASVPAHRRPAGARVLPWIGWAVAAGVAIAAGRFYQDRVALHRMLTAQTGQVVHLSADATNVYRQRDELTAKLDAQSRELDQLRSEAAGAAAEASSLRSAVTTQSSKLEEQKAATSQAAAQAANQAALAASVARERDSLRATIAAQASQVADLSTDAAKSREVLEALRDPTALRVTLTKPKSTPAPTGRVTYVASRGTLVFLASNLAPLKANKVYQLWLMPADGSKPIPAGTFSPDAKGSASVVSPQFEHPVAAKAFAVTIENEGGSQTPTLPIILLGA